MVERWRVYGIVFIFVERSVVHATQDGEMIYPTLFISPATIVL